ncbi:DUF47 domain-containing protein [Bogoriella caseilytica]|uniref:DUF47 domain-containing protein n=1 Tax=Bogoriella caseilytica TaxID=56055 RepID=UPI00147515D8|nr:DUF47 family protein [Bogoriella caseilytica]
MRGTAALRVAVLGQVRATIEGAAVARRMIEGESPAVARREIGEVERRGDRRRSDLVSGLSTTLVTPLDREDLFRISRSIDDALDTLQDFVREADLYGFEDRKRYLPLLVAADEALVQLETAVATLWIKPAEVPMRSIEVKKAARRVTRAYREEFARTVVAGTGSLKHRELIKRLDWVGIRISEAADALSDGALKRGY